MTQTRKNWYLFLSLLVLASLLVVTSMGIIRAGGMFRIMCIILDFVWLYLGYEALVAFAGKPKSESENSNTNQEQ